MNNTEHIAPLAVSVEDAARVVGYSRSGVYELIASGDLKAFKLGRRRLILMAELKAWIERAAKEGSR
jgi:excisionase family DNA binding protein